MDIGEVWALVYRGAKNAGSPEPEDAAQTVIYRMLRKGRDPTKVVHPCPRALWLKAGNNEAKTQKRRAARAVPLPLYDIAPDGSGIGAILLRLATDRPGVEDAVLNIIALKSLPAEAYKRAQREINGWPKRRGYRRTPRIRAMLRRMAA